MVKMSNLSRHAASSSECNPDILSDFSVLRLFVVMLISSVLLMVIVPNAHAVALGVNRASINFEDVLRGGYAEEVVTVTTDSQDMIEGEARLEGEAGAWINFSASRFNFSKDSPYELHVIVQPPIDAQVQTYPINMTIITGGIAHTDGKMGTTVRASFRIPILLKMSGTEHLLCTGGGIDVLDTEVGRALDVKVGILNRGNVRIDPNITVEIWNKDQSKMIDSKTVDFGSRISPTTTQSVVSSLSFDLEASQYWAKVNVPMCDYSDLRTFDVLSPGGIKDDGEFLRIDAPAWANTGDIIPIKAYFRNKGARGLRAVFKGTISRADDSSIVKVISTDEYVVDPDATAEMDTYFNPAVGGQYIISGKVFYNNKLTVERNTLINVNGSPVPEKNNYTLIVIVVLAIVILLLLIMIRRKKTRR